MDTTTVLEIIKMLDKRAFVSNMQCNHEIEMDLSVREYYRGKVTAYEELSNHLQSFIEGQLNAEENNTVE
jgi:hypothetical protein